MGILRDFEKRLEGAVEGFFARAFRSGLQPVELAKAAQRYAADYQQIGVSGTIVPNVYRFALSSDDLERFSGFQSSLKRELADVVRRTADDRGWTLQGPVRIELVQGDHVRVGTYELRGKVEAADERSQPKQAQPVRIVDERQPAQSGATQVMPASGRKSDTAVLQTREGRRYPLNGTSVVGRLPSCDVTLDDPSVSRRHARIARRSGEWTVEDLNSTNGVSVNGEQVGYAALSDGDRLEFGSVALTFSHGG